MRSVLQFVLFASLFILSCRKEGFITSPDAIVNITTDSLKYDTVFASAGSVTKSFKIINENNRKLRLSEIRLMGGSSSPFKMNLDGSPAVSVENIEIQANDSIYVFMQVNVDPNLASQPFILQDSIRIAYNGVERFVQLEAWGQNAHYLRGAEISSDQVFSNNLPYVVLGSLHVKPGAVLTIDQGCRLYFHSNAPMVVDGTLVINGTKDTVDRVWFRGDRLDEPYRDYPAAWPGIHFGEQSSDNVLNYVILSNAYQALAVTGPSVNGNPKLTLNQCIVDNAFDAGIITSNSSLTAVNCLVSNCGKGVQLLGGGQYRFTHCTLAGYSTTVLAHNAPVLELSDNDGTNIAPVDATFLNCIMWGDGGLVENEVLTERAGSLSYNVTFSHNFWKITDTPADATLLFNTDNVDPLFMITDGSNRIFDFHLSDISSALNTGTPTPVTIDLDGNSRLTGFPDPGCFEK